MLAKNNKICRNTIIFGQKIFKNFLNPIFWLKDKFKKNNKI